MAQIIDGKKTFIPLENNPAIMSELARNLGLGSNLGFHDVYSLHDADLLAVVPRPVYAILFTAHQDMFRRCRVAENEAMAEYTGKGPQEPVMWFKQTIGHACGLMALLHALANGGANAYVQPESGLAKLLKEAEPLGVADRADLLYNSEFLEKAHCAAAVKGDTTPPAPSDDNHNHYIAFVKAKDGHLWELNSGMKGPVDRGMLADDEDVLSDKALELGPRSFLKGENANDVRISVVALAPNFD